MISAAKAAERLLLAAVHHELRSPTEELDELCAQVSLGGRTPPARLPTEEAGHDGDGDSPDDESGRENGRGKREDGSGDPDRDRARAQGNEWWAEPTQVQALQGVDVADHPAHEIAAAVLLQASRG